MPPKRKKRRRIDIHSYAKRLRSNLTKAESVFWVILQKKMREWGVEFFSQGVVIDRFVADFVCYQHKLIIEIDGSVHRLRSVKQKDRYRTLMLNINGYRVVRFSNSVVLRNPYSVIRTIECEIKG